jgi:structure-specific recognition protein 1
MPRVAKKSSSPKKASPVKKEKKRAKKDPNAPKRGQSGYMIWLNANRASLTKPGMGVTDVAKAAGVEWGKLKERTKWDKLAAEDKKRYEREMVVFKAGGSPAKKSSPKKK